jgi:predicted signal transduction protein with EAL and GGDEF domain
MAHGLNMRVVAEGVETLEQAEFLLRRRCDDAQGFLFGRPVAKCEVPAMVERIVRELWASPPIGDEELRAMEFDVPIGGRVLSSGRGREMSGARRRSA